MECYELFSTKMGLIIDFRWFLWEIKPNKTLEEELTRMVLRHGNITEEIRLINSWYYQSISKSQNNIKLHGVRLNLYNVTKADEGYYSCVGCNNLGCAIRSARFTVIEDGGSSHLFFVLMFYLLYCCWQIVVAFPPSLFCEISEGKAQTEIQPTNSTSF